MAMMVIAWDQASKIARGWELYLGAERWYPVLGRKDFSSAGTGRCPGCIHGQGTEAEETRFHGFHLFVDDGEGPTAPLCVGIEDFMTSVQYRRPLNMPGG